MKINEKGLRNSYISGHLLGKGISEDLVRETLEVGKEFTAEVKHPKLHSRYFRHAFGAMGLPGRFVLPDLEGPLGGLVANWNATCAFKFRHGKLAPVVRRADLPEWLVQYASALCVIIEPNTIRDEKGDVTGIQQSDGPTLSDPEGDWLVATAFYGEPSRQKPRIPKDCADAKAVRRYLEDLDSFEREQSRVVFVDLEVDGQNGFAQKTEGLATDDVAELRRLVGFLRDEVMSLRKQTSRAEGKSRC